MNVESILEQRAKVEEFQRKHRIGLLALVFTDLVGSTKLKQELGDRQGVELIQRHHALVREILSRFREGEEIETAGDSFFLIFAKPSDAVRFSLVLQSSLRALSQELGRALLDRIGLHLGEVVIEERPDTPKPKTLYGLQVDVCARVTSLAEGDQILMTRSAFDNARQVLNKQDIEGLGALSWLHHGPYMMKGVEEPLEICECGEAGRAILKPPSDSEKVHRHLSPDAEPVLGWRPALDQRVAGTDWVLEEKLGEGGFGEVWLGWHSTTKERRVFKFCFRADRVRALKREATLFRLLKERVGEHPNVVRLLEIVLEEPPYYLEMEYVGGRDLKTWSQGRGGIGAIALETRLEIVAQVADGLQGAHDAGVIHRDVKPSNILIQSRPANPASPPIAKLTDFGIGQVVSEGSLAGITRLGFTQTMLSTGSTVHSGTQMYMAPELLAGRPASTRSDIYSLGVVLYQFVAGDFSKPVATDWWKEIGDPLLRQDLELCFAGDPNDRFVGAGQLARALRSLPRRRAERERNEALLAARERAAYRRGLFRAASLAAVVLALVAGLALLAWKKSRETRHLLYVANMNLAQQAYEANNMGRLQQLLEATRESPERGFEWAYWQRQSHLALRTLRAHLGGVTSAAFSPDGKRIVTGSKDWTAKVWDAAGGRELFTLTGHSNWILSAAFSPDGRRTVAGSGDHTAKVWDAASGKELLTLKGHSNWIGSVAFSPDSRRIVTGSGDETAKVWDAASGKHLLTLTGHGGQVWLAAFSPDGQRIVTGSSDKTAKVWESSGGEELLTLKGHSNAVTCVAFSPDGRRIVTGSLDKTARVWDAASPVEVEAWQEEEKAAAERTTASRLSSPAN
jgi:class 3 adenylate cyclase/tRNA A-37 threonylcarbamoyl transferase component Bud32